MIFYPVYYFTKDLSVLHGLSPWQMMENSNVNPTTIHELTDLIQSSFQQLQDKLNKTESEIVSRFNTTGKKIDQIEKTLVDLMDHAGVDE